MQHDPQTGKHLPVASHSRTWTELEPYESLLRLEVTALAETLSHLQYITAFASRIDIRATPEFRALLKWHPWNHPRLTAQILDIKNYNPHFVTTNPVLPAELAWDALDSWEAPECEALALPADLDAALRRPAKTVKAAKF